MWFFKCFFFASFIITLIANPIDNDLSNQDDSSPPMEFPQNDSKFPVVATNATLLHELSRNDSDATQELEQETDVKSQEKQQTENETQVKLEQSKFDNKTQEVDDSKIDTEVPDLLKIDAALIEPPPEPETNGLPGVNSDTDSDVSYAQVQHDDVPDEPINSAIATSTEEFPKGEVEWIQNGHDNEDIRLLADDDTLAPSNDYMREASSEHGSGVPLVQGRYAAILAGVFIVIAIVGYAAMLSWRRYLENRYGNRQMLINEEDIFSSNDLKHFSL